MAYVLKTNYADKSNYGGKRNKANIKYLVYHFTANDGDSDESNARFFKTKNRSASAHYFVDDDSVTISVADTNIAYSVGGKKWSDYTKTGGGKYYGKCTNANSISIEMCDTKKNGKYEVTEATMNNAIELGKKIMKEYNIPIENVIRHFDVNGKHCPAYFCCSVANDNAWDAFKAKLSDNVNTTKYDDVFNYSFYYNMYTDLQKAIGLNKNALFNHFLTYGMKEHRQGCATFDPVAYRKNNPDLSSAFGDAWTEYYNHYMNIGKQEIASGKRFGKPL